MIELDKLKIGTMFVYGGQVYVTVSLPIGNLNNQVTIGEQNLCVDIHWMTRCLPSDVLVYPLSGTSRMSEVMQMEMMSSLEKSVAGL